MKKTICFMMLLMLIFINLFFVFCAGGVYAAQPELKLEIIGGEEKYDLNDIGGGAVYIAKVFYDGKLLMGEDLKSVDLKWNPEGSIVEIKKEYRAGHLELSLHDKYEEKLDSSKSGVYSVMIHAFYVPDDGVEKTATAELTYVITDGSLSTDEASKAEERYSDDRYTPRSVRHIIWLTCLGTILVLFFFFGFKSLRLFFKNYLGFSSEIELYGSFYIARDDATNDAKITAEQFGNTLSVEVIYKDVITGVEINLKGGIIRQLMPYAFRRSIIVEAQSVYAIGNTNVEVINVGGTIFALNEKTRELQLEIPGVENFELTDDVYIKIFGTMLLNGVEEPFIVDIWLDL